MMMLTTQNRVYVMVARREGLAENGGFKPGMKKLLADGKLIIISMTVSGINDRIRFYS